jgi:all-trans-retinol dehydrogenase (NAD+)
MCVLSALAILLTVSTTVLRDPLPDQVKADAGEVDVLVNNAGIVSGRPLLELSDAAIERTMEVNVISHLWLARAVLPGMVQRDRGHIVCISSAAGLAGIPSLTDYCASKFAAFGFAESLRTELLHQGVHGVRTTIVCPFYIRTGMFEGVQAAHSWLCPMLEPDYVVARIMQAVEQDWNVLIMPRLLYLVPLLRTLLPVRTFDWIGRTLGFASSMDSFVGRKQE